MFFLELKTFLTEFATLVVNSGYYKNLALASN